MILIVVLLCGVATSCHGQARHSTYGLPNLAPAPEFPSTGAAFAPPASPDVGALSPSISVSAAFSPSGPSQSSASAFAPAGSPSFSASSAFSPATSPDGSISKPATTSAVAFTPEGPTDVGFSPAPATSGSEAPSAPVGTISGDASSSAFSSSSSATDVPAATEFKPPEPRFSPTHGAPAVVFATAPAFAPAFSYPAHQRHHGSVSSASVVVPSPPRAPATVYGLPSGYYYRRF